MLRGESEFGEKRALAAVPTCCGDHIDEGQHPCHEELGQRKEVGNVHIATDLLFHEIRKPTDSNRQRKVVNNEEDCRGNDQFELAADERLEVGVPRDGVPVRRGWSWGG